MKERKKARLSKIQLRNKISKPNSVKNKMKEKERKEVKKNKFKIPICAQVHRRQRLLAGFSNGRIYQIWGAGSQLKLL